MCGVFLAAVGYKTSDIGGESSVLAIDITALLTTGKEYSVYISYNTVRKNVRTWFAVIARKGIIAFRMCCAVGDNGSVFISHILTDNYADIIKLKTLTGMDTAYLLKGILIYCPCTAETEIRVPFCPEVPVKTNVVYVVIGVVLGNPVKQ